MNGKTLRNLFALAVAAVPASLEAPRMAQTSLASATAELADAPAAIGAAVTRVAANVAGTHLGFDTNVYPGDDAMNAWKRSGTYEWVGYYLPAPCHKDDSWSGRRQHLIDNGWGLAVIYVGQQTWGKTPRAGSRSSRSATCAANLVNAEQGILDADDAIAQTAAEGFPSGTAIFLDIEHMNTVPSAMREYYSAWTQRVLDDGRYRPAYYAHNANAQTIYADVRLVLDQRGLVSDPPFWIAGGSNFGRDRSPQEVGHQFAAVWQGVLDTWEKHDKVRLPIDVSVAAVPSPSSAQFASD